MDRETYMLGSKIIEHADTRNMSLVSECPNDKKWVVTYSGHMARVWRLWTYISVSLHQTLKSSVFTLNTCQKPRIHSSLNQQDENHKSNDFYIPIIQRPHAKICVPLCHQSSPQLYQNTYRCNIIRATISIAITMVAPSYRTKCEHLRKIR